MTFDLATLIQPATTKILLVVLDGLAGYATAERGTELEEADTPNLDALAAAPGDLEAALRVWEARQLEHGRGLVEHGIALGRRSVERRDGSGASRTSREAAERTRAFDDLVAWMEEGVVPEGDDVLAPDLSTIGLRWTTPLLPDDPAGRE